MNKFFGFIFALSLPSLSFAAMTYHATMIDQQPGICRLDALTSADRLTIPSSTNVKHQKNLNYYITALSKNDENFFAQWINGRYPTQVIFTDPAGAPLLIILDDENNVQALARMNPAPLTEVRIAATRPMVGDLVNSAGPFANPDVVRQIKFYDENNQPRDYIDFLKHYDNQFDPTKPDPVKRFMFGYMLGE